MNQTHPDSTSADLYILAGQSNMDGEGFVRDLPEHLTGIQDGAWIYSPNRRDDQQPLDDHGFWEPLRPGHGAGLQTDGKEYLWSDRFGPELSFAHRLLDLNPGQNILIYKYAKGGSSIHSDINTGWGCWDPDYSQGNAINQWSHFRHHLHRSLKRTKEIFAAVRPAGIVWHQGESDASHSKEIAESYKENLQKVIAAIRSEIGVADLPAVIGEISESWRSEESEDGKTLRYAEIVQEAQQKFVEEDPRASLVSLPGDHGWIDPWHYDSQTYIELGVRFADAMTKLEKNIVTE